MQPVVQSSIFMQLCFGAYMTFQLWAPCQAELQKVIMHVLIAMKVVLPQAPYVLMPNAKKKEFC